ncbi:hypothetical protein HRI_001905100 [Hibiscus trionum]|uniref:Uncharacterized protein n=1 Tax=Hibiscus trionum TaxID=183268 RepID=A0A9W7HT99_HIBTR|nr:hypothetical protein HRI_001905100 [Hibiscus trionum]
MSEDDRILSEILWSLTDFLSSDDSDGFVRYFKCERGIYRASYLSKQMFLTSLFIYFETYDAFKCATALLAGETGLDIDINDLDPDRSGLGSNPLFFTFTSPVLLDLYIRSGALTDIRIKGMLPLNFALLNMSWLYEKFDWSSKRSICLIIIRLFLDLEPLDSIRLLFEHTKEVDKEVHGYVVGGKLFETTALLLVGREKITSPSFFKDFTSSGSMSLHQLVLLELGNKLETMNSMLDMIEVVQSVGPEIDQYRQDIPELSMEELATKVACLFIKKGFVECEDLKRFEVMLLRLYKSVSVETLPTHHQCFLKLLGSKLHSENEGSELESKDVADAMLLNPIGSSSQTYWR